MLLVKAGRRQLNYSQVAQDCILLIKVKTGVAVLSRLVTFVGQPRGDCRESGPNRPPFGTAVN